MPDKYGNTTTIEKLNAEIPLNLMREALDAGLTQEQAIKLLSERFQGATNDEIARARNCQATGNIEIDDAALTSRAVGGFWISAWVWVPNETAAA